MSATAKAKAQLLLDAQVQFMIRTLGKKQLLPILTEELGFLYETLGQMTLSQMVSEEKIKATAQRYAVEMEIGGGIPELFGEIANLIYEHPANQNTLIGDIVSDRAANELIEKIFEPDSIVDKVVQNVGASHVFKLFISDLIFTVLKGYLLEQNGLMKLAPIASSTQFVRNWIGNKAPELSDNLEDRIRSMMEAGLGSSFEVVTELLAQEQYRDTAQNDTLTLWDTVKTWPIGQFRNYVTEQDLQELMVLGYEFWLELRHTDYLKACIDTGVSFFFSKYGDEPLQFLLSELGVTEDMIVSELENYLPDLAEILIKQDIAEPIIRRHLTRFYFDKKTLKLLAE